MDISMGIGLLCLGAVLGALVVVGWFSPDKTLREQFDELPAEPLRPDEITRRSQV